MISQWKLDNHGKPGITCDSNKKNSSYLLDSFNDNGITIKASFKLNFIWVSFSIQDVDFNEPYLITWNISCLHYNHLHFCTMNYLL
ncbi:unnamed protein product [Schistosoma margrebowiei]|uniref:Uncharacterized protein n=1 Tax=Schistosoma margrebowiei TaxID=48269 RepID=A0A183NC64_9TREM|nr:unnamed protein product [Schistosoma margrebowiei]